MDGNPLTNRVKPGDNGTDTGSANIAGLTLTPKEAGDYAGVSRSTINNHVQGRATPLLKAHRGNDANKGWRIRRDDLDEWMREKGIKKPSPTSDNPSANVVTIPVTHATPSAGEGAILRVKIEGLEARLADAQSTITDLRTRLDAQAADHKEALGAAEARHRDDMQAQADRHREALSAETAKREQAEARVVTLLEGQAAAAKEAGILEGKVGILEDKLQEAQKQASEAILALERMKPLPEETRASGGILALVRAAIVGR